MPWNSTPVTTSPVPGSRRRTARRWGHRPAEDVAEDEQKEHPLGGSGHDEGRGAHELLERPGGYLTRRHQVGGPLIIFRPRSWERSVSMAICMVMRPSPSSSGGVAGQRQEHLIKSRTPYPEVLDRQAGLIKGSDDGRQSLEPPGAAIEHRLVAGSVAGSPMLRVSRTGRPGHGGDVERCGVRRHRRPPAT